jgi:hypothetical protein
VRSPGFAEHEGSAVIAGPLPHPRRFNARECPHAPCASSLFCVSFRFEKALKKPASTTCDA